MQARQVRILIWEWAMGAITKRFDASTAKQTAELHRYDKDLLGANWKPAIGMLALSCGHSEQELRPQLPEDSAKLEPGFVVRIRALASRI
jgi:hypothetical protein